uniref:Uncharacterized protein n=1 Tax=Strigops habroptila TaxID=2489341 RepID=A0A672UGK0_STRHB
LLSITSQVVTGLYLGNIRDSEDHESLRRNGVTHILSIHNSAKPVLEVSARVGGSGGTPRGG